MKRLVTTLSLLTGFAVVSTFAATPAGAENSSAPELAVILPATVTFATSTGYWRSDASHPDVVPLPGSAAATPSATSAAPRHGYYKLYAVRQPDRTSKVYLQQIAADDDGPQVLSTVELSEITALKAFVTDIRPENSGGIIREPGLFASVILKTDPDGETENWTVLIDDLGEITVERAPN